jgi:hypothetical protein
MGEIGDQAGFVGPAGHGNSHSDSFPTELNFFEKDVSLAHASSGHQARELLTTAAIAHDAIQNSHELGNNMVDLIEACQDRDDIRAGVCVLFAQDAGQEDRQGLKKSVSQ